MATRTPRVFFDEKMIEHDPGRGHPECPDRLRSIDAHLAELFPDLERHSAAPATSEQIKRVHGDAYVDSILARRGERAVLDPDTILSPGSVDAAVLASGMAVAAVEYTVGENAPSFALVRPPGHHAVSDRAMGFCIFNNIAVAAAHAVEELDLDRVLIVDWDVHHGNGTEAIFYERDDVFFFSTHQFPFYPGTGKAGDTGRGDGEGFTLNVPLPAGTGDEELIEIFRSQLVPAARDFGPDLILVSAGFDAHCLDPIGGMQVTTDGFGSLLEILLEIADEECSGRLAMVLEGGYHLEALARSVGRCIEVLQNK